MSEKLQTILDAVDGACALVGNKSFVRKTKFLGSPIYVLMAASACVGLGLLVAWASTVMFSSQIALGAAVLSLFASVWAPARVIEQHNKQARQHNILCVGDISVFEIEPADDYDKLVVLQRAKSLNMSNEQMQQLIAISERPGVPQGWWGVLSEALEEEHIHHHVADVADQLQLFKDDLQAEHDIIVLSPSLKHMKL